MREHDHVKAPPEDSGRLERFERGVPCLLGARPSGRFETPNHQVMRREEFDESLELRGGSRWRRKAPSRERSESSFVATVTMTAEPSPDAIVSPIVAQTKPARAASRAGRFRTFRAAGG